MQVLELSTKTGDGFDAWIDLLTARRDEAETDSQKSPSTQFANAESGG